ncbi:MAG: hypothetical protein ACJAYU_002684 [Bradymonadia bacterium]|jgi:hypothetical protein
MASGGEADSNSRMGPVTEHSPLGSSQTLPPPTPMRITDIDLLGGEQMIRDSGAEQGSC